VTERASAGRVVLIVAGAIALNCALSFMNTSLKLPFFIDSVGTAIAASVTGPWVGALTGALTNGAMDLMYGAAGEHLPFAVVNAVTGIMVGFAARYGFLRNVGHIVAVITAVAVANAALGALIVTLVYGGTSGSVIDYIVAGFTLTTSSKLFAAFMARVPANLVDKSLTVGAAAILLWWLQRSENMSAEEPEREGYAEEYAKESRSHE